MTRAAAFVTAFLIASGTAMAGPWGREPGHYYMKLSGSRLATTTLATPAGEEVEIPEFELRVVDLYGEFGLGRGLTALTTVPFQHRTRIEDFDTASGFGDLRVGLQMDLERSSSWVAALRAMVQAPTGDATKGGGVLPTGSGVWESELLASIGRSFRGGYAFGEAGYQIRGDGFRDGFVYRARVGFDLGSHIDVAVHVHGVEPYSDRSVGFVSSGAGLGNGVRYAVIGPSLSIAVGRGVAVDVDIDHSFHGRNLATGTTVRIGLSLSR